MALIAAQRRGRIMFWNYKVILDQAEATESATRGAFLFHERWRLWQRQPKELSVLRSSISSLSLIPHSPAIRGPIERLTL